MSVHTAQSGWLASPAAMTPGVLYQASLDSPPQVAGKMFRVTSPIKRVQLVIDGESCEFFEASVSVYAAPFNTEHPTQHEHACTFTPGDLIKPVGLGLVKLNEFPWNTPVQRELFPGGMAEVTCVHHQGARYLMKSLDHTLHFVGSDVALARAVYGERIPAGMSDAEISRVYPAECACPWDDLRVRISDESES